MAGIIFPKGHPKTVAAQANGGAQGKNGTSNADLAMFDLKDLVGKDIRWLVTKATDLDLKRVIRLREALV